MQTENTITNSLKYKVQTKDSEGNTLFISIRLDDECKNGHQDFSITASAYQKGKPLTDRNFIYGGCCHEEILKVKPDFKIFVDLHLCDYKGIPMHAGANGFYFLRNGFNNTKVDDAKFINEYCEYYRITELQFNELNKTKNVLQFSLALQKLGILDQWELQANEAIKLLEGLTNMKFLIDSKRTQFVEPTKKEIEEEETKVKNGYYTAEAEKKRFLKARNDKRTKKRNLIDDEIKSLEAEFSIFSKMLDITEKDNYIVYNHSKQVKFNWKDYGEKFTDKEIEEIKNIVKLPKGYSFTI
jgi:hypothetical protein